MTMMRPTSFSVMCATILAGFAAAVLVVHAEIKLFHFSPSSLPYDASRLSVFSDDLGEMDNFAECARAVIKRYPELEANSFQFNSSERALNICQPGRLSECANGAGQKMEEDLWIRRDQEIEKGNLDHPTRPIFESCPESSRKMPKCQKT